MKNPITYKGYCAKIEYSDEQGCLIGRVSDISRSITFQGDSVEKIRQAFEEAVDLYLTDCAERNEEPEKPAARKVVRVSSALYSVLALAAKQEKKSVNEWLAETRKKKNDTEDKE
ncbi:MAG: toxin-antitoxin system HicB family antitoxin [Deltaproteobacteria bacterium HGW-Deltaproteobacteria-13]|jgi:predicted HicB family RNase H-like nuclease|nr:MAG: toxin-antitoxin system HicB family antitoxin [Deltaproteobacteria bacterium HGW-Deltaproteobacteria-13]